MPQSKERRLSNVEVTPERVSLRADGVPMEAVRVKMGVNHVWRIRFADERLSHQTFANADRAVRWIACGMPVAADQDSTAPIDPRATPEPVPPARWRGKRKGVQPPPEQEPDPIWEPLDWIPRERTLPPPAHTDWSLLDWESREEKLAADRLAAVPGAPKLLDGAAVARAATAAPRPAAATPAPDRRTQALAPADAGPPRPGHAITRGR